jgi:hypothetical protein
LFSVRKMFFFGDGRLVRRVLGGANLVRRGRRADNADMFEGGIASGPKSGAREGLAGAHPGPVAAAAVARHHLLLARRRQSF